LRVAEAESANATRFKAIQRPVEVEVEVERVEDRVLVDHRLLAISSTRGTPGTLRSTRRPRHPSLAYPPSILFISGLPLAGDSQGVCWQLRKRLWYRLNIRVRDGMDGIEDYSVGKCLHSGRRSVVHVGVRLEDDLKVVLKSDRRQMPARVRSASSRRCAVPPGGESPLR